jgi:hypothetical protein
LDSGTASLNTKWNLNPIPYNAAVIETVFGTDISFLITDNDPAPKVCNTNKPFKCVVASTYTTSAGV